MPSGAPAPFFESTGALMRLLNVKSLD